MNIRTPLTRSFLAIGLIAASATAASLQPEPSQPTHKANSTLTAVRTDEPLSVTWLPMVKVTANTEPLRVTWLPTVRVIAHINDMGMAEPALASDDALAANTLVDLRLGSK